MPVLLLATSNPGKRLEMNAILAELGYATGELPGGRSHGNWQVIDAGRLGIALDVEEDGETYAQNAARKALAYCRASGEVTLADDSGLEVDALLGAPGIHSARYAPEPGATDADRRRLLLRCLTDQPRPWRARFHCTVVIAVPGAIPPVMNTLRATDGLMDDAIALHYFEGWCEGEIIPEERGSNGFGYDPIFFLPGQGRTMAELTTREKNRISHRGRALAAAKHFLDSRI